MIKCNQDCPEFFSVKESLNIDFRKESDRLLIFSSKPVLSSGKANWNNIDLAHYVLPASEIPEHFPTQAVIAIHHQPLKTVDRSIGGNIQREHVETGNVVVVPANLSHSVRWYEEASFTLMLLDTEFINRTAYEFMDPDQVEILPRFSHPDQLIYRLGQRLKSKLSSNTRVCQVYIESAASVLAVHLLMNYCRSKATNSKIEGLTNRKLQLVVDYVNAHLDQNFGLITLAQLANMSRAHFIRQFKHSMGVSPHQYLMQCRLDKVKHLLANTDLSIAEIAQRTGFSSHSHLSKAFCKHLSMTPHRYRQI
jgi:AraC family transcriptional regulator